VNSSDSSRGSAPKIGRVAIGTTCLKRGVALWLSIQLLSVWLSQSSALCAVHGASTGTSVAIWSSSATTAVSSGRISGSGGALPVGPVSL
jgi:hypothetical protein